MDRLADFRSVYAQMVVARGGCSGNEALLRAFATVPRHAFVGPGPWVVAEDGTSTPTNDAALVYQDVGLGLAPTIPTGLPSLHARFLNALNVVEGERVMQIGAGTGYFTAVLAELVGPNGRIDAYEIEPTLARQAQDNLRPWPWVTVHARSGVAPTTGEVDVMYVNAGVQQLPPAWVRALSARGRMVFPLVPGDDAGAVFLVRRGRGDTHPVRFVCRASFVPCIGAQDDAATVRLAEAFRSDQCERVASLGIGAQAPDGTAWFTGDGWWLSAA